MTLTSASARLAIIPNSVDLPTPEPAKMPKRWPRPQGINVSNALIDVARGVSMRLRLSG